MALGLVSSETLDDFWSQNTRRRVFFAFPNGAAPLTGLLSMMDSEDTPDPEFGWFEERWQSLYTQVAEGPTSQTYFYLGGTNTTAGSPATVTQFQNLRVYVDDATNFQEDDTIKIF